MHLVAGLALRGQAKLLGLNPSNTAYELSDLERVT